MVDAQLNSQRQTISLYIHTMSPNRYKWCINKRTIASKKINIFPY